MKKMNPAVKLRRLANKYDNTIHVEPYIAKLYAIMEKWAEAGHYQVNIRDLDKGVDLLNYNLRIAVYERLVEMGFEVSPGDESGYIISWGQAGE